MRANEILIGTNDVVVNDYLVDVHPDLSLVLDVKGVMVMDDLRMLEFVPYFNIVNVVQISPNNENSFYITCKEY